MHRRAAAFALLMVMVVAACGAAEPAPTPVIDETGTALEPLAPDPAFEVAARDVCLPALSLDSSTPVDFQDRRTNTMAYLQFSTEFKHAGCLVRGNDDGTFTLVAAHEEPQFNSSGVEFGLTSSGWIHPAGWFVSGHVPPDVTEIWLERADGSRVRASAANGRFIAWWLGDLPATAIIGLKATGIEIVRTPASPVFFE
jgi:hypothetical protein